MATATRDNPAGRGKPQPRPGDTTALRAQALEVERDETAAEEARLAEEKARIEDEARRHEIIDYSKLDTPLVEVVPDEVENDEPFREVLMKYDCPQFVYGRDWDRETGDLRGIPMLDLKQGRRYRLPTPMAKHLDSRGFLFH